MKKNMNTTLLVIAGLYFLISRKKIDANTMPEGKRILPTVPVIRDSSKTTPIEKSTIEPFQKFPNPQVTKKIMDPYENYYPSRTTPVNPKSITKDAYKPIGGDIDEELYSSVDGEIVPDRDLFLKNVDTNYQDNLYKNIIKIGYRPSSGFVGSGLADM